MTSRACRGVGLAVAALALSASARAQNPTAPTPLPQQPPGIATPQDVPPNAPVPPNAVPQVPPTGQPQTGDAALPPDRTRIDYEEIEFFGTSGVRGKNVVITLGEYTLSGGRLEGDFEKELVFTDNPKLTYRGQTVAGDSIRFNPKTKAYRVENLHTALTPEFLQGRVTSPLFLSGAQIFGQRRNPVYGEDIDATTCDYPDPHYFLRASTIILEPGKRLTLRKATLFLWGHRIITLPTLVIPLDQQSRRFRANNLPQVGRSQEEGWFAKSAFNYALGDRLPGLMRLDLMEKKGVGIGFDQAYNLLKMAGGVVFYTIPTGGTNRNLSGRINHRQNLGGGQTISLDNDFQRNSYQSLPESTNFNTRLGYNRTVGGWSTGLNLSRQATDSSSTSLGTSGTPIKSNFLTRSYAANLTQSVQLSRSASMNFNSDYSRYSSSSPGFGGAPATFQINEQLNTRFQADQRGENYLLQLAANKSIPIGKQAQSSFFGGVEKLPEVTLSNYRFTQGVLSRLPASFQISAGKYQEGGTTFGAAASSSRISTERVVAGVDFANTRVPLTPRTDLNFSGGFQQFFYGMDGVAQYVVRNNTTLSQRWNKKSGLNLNYTYQQPEGGTPFRFDQQGRYHALNADIGFLDDRRLQATARVGYDFGQSAFGGVKTPWQTLSINTLFRPVDWARFRSLLTFDPNTSRFVSATGDLRFRGHNDMAADIVGRFDPQRHKFGQINGYLNLPIGKLWRVIGLVQYNGYLNKFESRNIQIIRDLHCLEASLTYIDNPFGFRNDKQIFFTLRIKAFPVFQRFGVGQFGQAIDTSVGEIY